MSFTSVLLVVKRWKSIHTFVSRRNVFWIKSISFMATIRRKFVDCYLSQIISRILINCSAVNQSSKFVNISSATLLFSIPIQNNNKSMLSLDVRLKTFVSKSLIYLLLLPVFTTCRQAKLSVCQKISLFLKCLIDEDSEKWVASKSRHVELSVCSCFVQFL